MKKKSEKKMTVSGYGEKGCASQGVLVIVWLIKAAEVGVARMMMSSQARYRKPLYKRELSERVMRTAQARSPDSDSDRGRGEAGRGKARQGKGDAN